MLWFLLLIVVVGVVSAKIEKTRKRKVEEDIIVEETTDEFVEEVSFDEDTLIDNSTLCVSQLVDFGLPEIEARYLFDHLNACHLENDYIDFIEQCQKRRVELKDNRIKELTQKLEAKAAKGVNPNLVAMARDFLLNANSKEQLDRVEKYISQMRASSSKPKAAVVPKPVPKKKNKTA